MKNKFFLFLTFLGIDRLTKHLTALFVPKMSWMDTSYPFGGYGIFRNFLGGVSLSINHVENMGAAWGIFSGYSEYLLFLRILIVLSLIIYTIFFNDWSPKKVVLSLIITGAVGNILDFFIYGHVIDMIHVNLWGYTFPVFNFADIMITVGIASLFFLSIARKKGIKAPA